MKILRIENLSKRFGGVQALSKISLELEQGKLTSLIGPNGSGKTTLPNLITGVYRSDSGSIEFEGRNLQQMPPYSLCGAGISRTFQIQQLFNELTVMENIMVGCHWWAKSGVWSVGWRTPGARREEQAIQEEAQGILNFVGLGERAHELAQNLSYGEQRLLEIGKALAARPRLLLLDEPAAGFNHQETFRLGVLLRDIIKKGITILLVEHDMPLVMSISDQIIVFHQGEKLCSGNPQEISQDPRVIAAYLGGDDSVPA